MPTAQTAAAAEQQLDAAALDDIVKGIAIPPRPQVVLQMQNEMRRDEPDVRRAAQIVSQDVGLTVAVLKTVNSPLYGLNRRVESVEQAVNLLGMRPLSVLVTALAMRNAVGGDAQALARFYDTSAKRAFAMARMARGTRAVDPTLAQTFGLFSDVGIPLLMNRFGTPYRETLQKANSEAVRSFTEVEQDVHHTDHALVGAMMARAWGLPAEVVLAIRLHHDYAMFLDPKVPRDVARLVALALVAEAAILRFGRLHASAEWAKGGDYVAGALVLSPDEVEDWIEQLVDDFATSFD